MPDNKLTYGDYMERKKRWLEFTSTPIGAAFEKYDRLAAIAWQKDTQFGMDGIGEKSAKEARTKSEEARAELLKLLGFMERPI